jgi:hypothetical protein
MPWTTPSPRKQMIPATIPPNITRLALIFPMVSP